jgi:hypothetical protein
VLSRWQGGLGALVISLAACGLVILDLTDDGLRRWWTEHALTTGTVSGLLVLLITVLVADQVVRLRQTLGGELVRALAAARPGGHGGYVPGRLDNAVRQLKNASAPLLQALDPETRQAVRGDQPA